MTCGSDIDDQNTEDILTDHNIASYSDWVKHIEDLWKKHPKNVITSFLNINPIRNKFKNIMDLIGIKIDVTIFGETKLNDSFKKPVQNTWL